ncbi:MAG: carboxypeptidase-like regulatory domain-containing protein [Muribaculaceae bacterium]|nr:carboxypeptidase-like regulatory domain-containing protein [Muribaculaceae bacterium]
MARLIAILCLSVLLTFTVRGEGRCVISGTVTNDAGQPLKSVMVRATVNGKNGPFVMTDPKGNYTLSIESEEASVTIGFSKLGYEPEKKTLDNKPQRLDITLSKSAQTLPEVTVSNPEVRLRGDTISFLLSAFAGKGDVSLKDALKKVPGVEVASSGEISYNGKNISNFYIEGMDLMGGKYDIATTNIPSSYVDAIEILNNHKDKKIDRDIFSDNVAMNVRLKPKAKIRPTGTYSASVGLGDPIPLAASGAGMLFHESFQSILTLKGSDISEFSERENYRFFNVGGSVCKDYTADILGRLSASSPPLSRSRWIRPIDTSATGNFIRKTGKDATLRADVGYSFLKTRYDYSESRAYFDGDDDVLIAQMSTPKSRSHKPSLSVEYKLDKDDIYLANYFSGKGTFSTDLMNISTPSKDVGEKERLNNINFRDYLDISWKKSRMRWYSSTSMEFTLSPEGYIDISENPLPKSSDADIFRRHLLQEGRSRSFSITERLQTMREIKRSRVFVPLEISYTDTRIRTQLSYQPSAGNEPFAPGIDGSRNYLDGSTLSLGLSPEYSYTAPYERFVVRATFPITMKHIDWSNKGTKPSYAKGTHLLLAPNVYLIYKASSKSTFRMTASYGNTIGDMLDMLTAPVMRDYMSVRCHSGLLSKRNAFNANLHYDFKLPLSFWFLNADIGYTHTRENLISRQDVSSGLIETSDSILPHGNDMISGSLGISKNIRSINTKISLKGGWSTSRNKIDQNGQTVSYHGDNIFVSPSVTTRPLDWLEVDYEGDISNAYSRYLGRRQSFSSQRHDLGISFYPLDRLQFSLKSSFIRKEIEDNRYRSLSLFDAKVVYKIKKMRLTGEVRNILNQRNYSYTLFSGLDRFTYDYRLRGREFILSLEYHL